MQLRLFAAVFALVVAGWLMALGTAGASQTLDDAKTCRKALTSKGRTYADKRLRHLLNCIDKLLKCELTLEIDGENPNACRSRATDACKRSIGPSTDSGLNRAADSFDEKIGTACLPFGVAAMKSIAAGGLWFANDATCGGSPDLPSLLDCLRAELNVETDSIVSNTKPRAGLLLDNAGLGDGFPNITRPPETTVPPLTATGAGSGVLVNPGTIISAAGNAVKFTGDATTLPCGGGQNGKVTISISTAADPCTDATAQQLVIKESYGPSETATFGPFTADQNYCVELKDGPCSDTQSGAIDVQ